MIKAASRESAKPKTDGASGRAKTRVDAALRTQPNPVWQKLAVRVQPKRRAGAAGEPYGAPSTTAARVQRKCAACEEEEKSARAQNRVQRKCAACEEDARVRRHSLPNAASSLEVGDADDVHEREADRIAGKVVQPGSDAGGSAAGLAPPTMDPGTDAELRSGGAALPRGVRSYFEDRLGHDFGHVRVHDGAESVQRNHDIQAHAFTYSNHVWLGRNQPIAPSFVMAHELVHVVQQTQPARVQAHADPDAPAGLDGSQAVSDARPVVRRLEIFSPYWEPFDHDGAKNHRLVLPEMGKTNNIFTEAPVPNASKIGAQLGTNVSGEADLYSGTDGATPRTVGVAYQKAGEPVALKANADTKFKGAKFAHATESAPQAGGLLGSALVTRIDKAPTRILVADLKPSHGTIESLEGTGQLDNYIAGFRIAEHETNDLATGGKGEPASAKWNIADIGKLTGLAIPDQFKEPLASGQTSKRLILKEQTSKIIPKTEVLGKIFVKEGDAGIYNYTWVPDDKKTGAGGLPATLSNLKKGIQQDIILPATTLPKTKRIKGAVAAIRRDASGLLRRKDVKAPVETFDLTAWNKKVDDRTAEYNGIKKTGDFEEATFKRYAAEAAMASHKSGFSVDATEEQKGNVESLKSIEFWTGLSAKTVGVFRKVFGKTFVKVLLFYEKARDKLRDMFKSKSAPSGGGGLPGAVLKATYKIIKAAARLLVQRTASELFGSFQRGATDWIKSLLPVEAVETLQEKVNEIDALQKEIEDKVKAEVEDLLGKTVGPYEELVKDFETAAQAAAAVAAVINLVKWGTRVVACVSPPAWGCLWLLAQPAIEYLASLAVESCWFQKAAAPLLTGIDFVKKIPKKLANLIIDNVIKPIMPTALHPLFPAIDISADVNPDDMECDPPDADKKQSAMNLALTSMASAMGEEKMTALVRLIEAAGVSKTQSLTLSDVACLQSSIVDKGVTAEQLTDYAKQYPVLPEGVPGSLQVCIKVRVPPPPPKVASGGSGGGRGASSSGSRTDSGRTAGDATASNGGDRRSDNNGDRGEGTGTSAAKPPSGTPPSGSPPSGSPPSGAPPAGAPSTGARTIARGGKIPGNGSAGAGAGVVDDWPIIYEEAGFGHFRIWPDPEVANGTQSIVKPTNSGAIMRVAHQADGTIVLQNTTQGNRTVAVLAPSTLISGGFVVISGPLKTWLDDDFSVWRARNRSPQLTDLVTPPLHFT
ncbi:MAG: DUF4157 domain-containing protein [bacterium]